MFLKAIKNNCVNILFFDNQDKHLAKRINVADTPWIFLSYILLKTLQNTYRSTKICFGRKVQVLTCLFLTYKCMYASWIERCTYTIACHFEMIRWSILQVNLSLFNILTRAYISETSMVTPQYFWLNDIVVLQ